jgi:hypothetical protein
MNVLLLVCMLMLPELVFGQTIFFKEDAESDPISSHYGQVPCNPAGCWTDHQYLVTRSQKFAKTGSWSLQHVLDPAGTGGDIQTGKVILQANSPVATGAYGWEEAYYSAWFYIESGLNDYETKNNFEFKTRNAGVTVSGGVKIVAAFTNPLPAGSGPRQITMKIDNCNLPLHAFPEYEWDTTQPCHFKRLDPILVPSGKWFHVEMYLKATATNGKLLLWQDGVEVFNLSHPNFNTLTVFNSGAGKWSDNKFLYWAIGAYGDVKSNRYVLYTDDAMVTNYPVHLNSYSILKAPIAPTTLAVK